MVNRSTYYGPIKIGNRKIGMDTAIFSICSAHDCPAAALGFCQLAKQCHCYAWLNECRFAVVLEARRRIEQIWNQGNALFADTLNYITTFAPVSFCRFSESGDMRTQDDITQLFDLARAVPQLQFYGYSARSDLRWSKRPRNLILNGSGWSRGNMNRFAVVDRYTGRNPTCPGSCFGCSLCKKEDGKTIETLYRKPGRKPAA